MAAGVGSRISKYINVPKATLPVNSETIITHAIKLLNKNGVDVAVVTGYMSDYVEDVLRDYNVTIYKNPFYKVTNSVASLWMAREFIKNDEDLLLMNADVYWNQDSLDHLLKSQEPITMLGDDSRLQKGDFFFKLKNNYVVDYGKTLPIHSRSIEYIGLAKIDSSIVDLFVSRLDKHIMDEKYDDWWENVLYSYLEVSPIKVINVNGCFWAEADYIEDYQFLINNTQV